MLGEIFWPKSLIFCYIAIHLHSQWNLRNHLLIIHELYPFCVTQEINSNTKCLTIYRNTALYRFDFKSEVKIQNGNIEAYAIRLYLSFFAQWMNKKKKKKNYLQHWLIYSTSRNHCLDS